MTSCEERCADLMVENAVLNHKVAELKEALDNSREINYELKRKLDRKGG
jgi:hypothetical protein